MFQATIKFRGNFEFNTEGKGGWKTYTRAGIGICVLAAKGSPVKGFSGERGEKKREVKES